MGNPAIVWFIVVLQIATGSLTATAQEVTTSEPLFLGSDRPSVLEFLRYSVSMNGDSLLVGRERFSYLNTTRLISDIDNTVIADPDSFISPVWSVEWQRKLTEHLFLFETRTGLYKSYGRIRGGDSPDGPYGSYLLVPRHALEGDRWSVLDGNEREVVAVLTMPYLGRSRRLVVIKEYQTHSAFWEYWIDGVGIIKRVEPLPAQLFSQSASHPLGNFVVVLDRIVR